MQGPGTLTVAGNTLYFFTYDTNGVAFYGLPRLSSLAFSEWHPVSDGSELVTECLRAYNVLEYRGMYWWSGLASPLYPSGSEAVTLSVEDHFNQNEWAIDAVVQRSGTGALVHYLRSDCPSVLSANREVVTFPGYTCRAFPSSSVLCATIEANGRYSWTGETHIIEKLGNMTFKSLS